MDPLVRRLQALVALAAVVLTVGTTSVLASPKKLDSALRGHTSSGPVRVIIRTRQGAAAAVRDTLEKHGRRLVAQHASIDAMTADVDAGDLAALAARPDVLSVSVDADVTATTLLDLNGVTSATRSPSTQTYSLRAALGYGQAFDGAQIGVALIDSGIQPLPAFGGRIRAFFDFTDGIVEAVPARDDYGHGTHVAGLIAANDRNYMGVAPAAHLVGLKVLDSSGRGRTSDVIRAIEFAVSNRALYGIRVINLSLGHPIFAPAADDPLVQAVESAVRAGLVVVVSVGNYGTNRETGEIGYSGVTSPGNSPSAITVGAADTKATLARSDDEVTKYSSRGPTWYDAFAKPDVVAPGHAMQSTASIGQTLYRQLPSLQWRSGSSRYLTLSGTSMAAGVTSGVVATMLEANAVARPHGSARLTPNAVKAMLQFTATPIRLTASDALADGLTQGSGQINADGALRLAYYADTAVPAGGLWIDPSHPDLQRFSAFGGETVAWAGNIVWGESILWGDTVFANEPAWAANIVWGEAAFAGTAWSVYVNWADNIVWSMLDDNIVWGANIVWGEGLVRSAAGDNIVWGLLRDADNIVWGNLMDDNIVWSNLDDNIVWGLSEDQLGGLR